MSIETLTEWMESSRKALGKRVDNGDGIVVRGALGVSPGMNIKTAEEAADAIGFDLNEVRSMTAQSLFDKLEQAGY